MTLKEAKHIVKAGLYDALYKLSYERYNSALIEIIERVLDNIDEKTLEKAINKATR